VAKQQVNVTNQDSLRQIHQRKEKENLTFPFFSSWERGQNHPRSLDPRSDSDPQTALAEHGNITTRQCPSPVYAPPHVHNTCAVVLRPLPSHFLLTPTKLQTHFLRDACCRRFITTGPRCPTGAQRPFFGNPLCVYLYTAVQAHVRNSYRGKRRTPSPQQLVTPRLHKLQFPVLAAVVSPQMQ
jgi:hypothetical protein